MFYVAHTGTTLYLVGSDGVISALTLPSGVAIDANRRTRWAILGRDVIAVNGPTRNLVIRPYSTSTTQAYQLTLRPPATKPILAAGAAGALNGKYRAKVAFGIKDEAGKVVSLSPYGPPSDESATLVNQALAVSAVQRSQDPGVNFRRIARTASGPGTEYFDWLDLDGNFSSSFEDNVTDEGLSTLSIPTDLGEPPVRFKLIVQWKDRLWGVPVDDFDTVYYSASRKSYGWPVSQAFPVPPQGKDLVGVVLLLARRDELGIIRQDVCHKIIGRTVANFERVQLADGKGGVASDSGQVIHDIGYWLGGDGVYSWGPKGVECVSNQVAGWFQSDRYFNRAQFPNAIGHYNEKHNLYQLLLAATGSTNLDRWVGLELDTGRWHGPHKTAAFTPTAASEIQDSNGLTIPVLGSSAGFLYKQNQSTYADDGNAIDFDVKLRHTGNTPDIEKVFLEMTAHVRPEAGGTLDIIPQLGTENAGAQATISRNLTLDRQRVRRISTADNPTGRMLTLRFRNNELNRGVQLRGYEIPYFEEGRR
jgi:hypothetical protein